MTIYLDSSVLVKRYVDEPDSPDADRILASDRAWTTAYLTLAEVRRTLVRNFGGTDLANVRGEFDLDWAEMDKIEVDRFVCARAADFAEITGVRTLDAIHLAAASRAGAPQIPFVTFDRRQARAARSLGWPVLGA